MSILGAITKWDIKFDDREIAYPMNEPGSSAQTDPLLSPFLSADDKEEEQERLQELLTQISEVLKKTTSDADEYQEAMRRLIIALRNCKANPDNNPIRSFQRYASTVAKHVRMGQIRAARPEFTALKEELRRLLRADSGFALWKSESGKLFCGLPAWQGQASPLSGCERLTRLSNDPLGCEDEFLDGRNALHINSEELVVAIFQWLDHPLKLDELTEIIFELKRLSPFILVPEPEFEDDDRSLSDITPSPDPLPDKEAEYREFLELLWAEIEELPHYQRIALLLNFTLTDGEQEIFVLYGVAGVRRIGRTIKLSEEHFARWWSGAPDDEEMPGDNDEKFAALWKYLPLNDLTIAEILGTTRQNIINLRSSALKRIRRRMANLR